MFYKPDVQHYYPSFPLIPERSPLCSIGNEGYGIIYTYYTAEHHSQAVQGLFKVWTSVIEQQFILGFPFRLNEIFTQVD